MDASNTDSTSFEIAAPNYSYNEGAHHGLSFEYGVLSDEKFRRENICIIVGTSSVATYKYGALKDLGAIYPYGDILSLRRRNENPTRAITVDQNEPGQVILCRPPASHRGLPLILNLITQYGNGREIDNNYKNALYACHVKEDPHFTKNLENDTLTNRIGHFKKCMAGVRDIALDASNINIDTYVIALGVGQSGTCNENWLTCYFPHLQSFAKFLHRTQKRLIITCSKNQPIPEAILKQIR